jgi:hypothetical protein
MSKSVQFSFLVGLDADFVDSPDLLVMYMRALNGGSSLLDDMSEVCKGIWWDDDTGEIACESGERIVTLVCESSVYGESEIEDVADELAYAMLYENNGGLNPDVRIISIDGVHQS